MKNKVLSILLVFLLVFFNTLSVCAAGTIDNKCGDDITWTLDGEEGIKGSAEVKNLHSHIKIFVPHKKDKPRSKYLK